MWEQEIIVSQQVTENNVEWCHSCSLFLVCGLHAFFLLKTQYHTEILESVHILHPEGGYHLYMYCLQAREPFIYAIMRLSSAQQDHQVLVMHHMILVHM